MVSSMLDLVAGIQQRTVYVLLGLFCLGNFLACDDDTWVVIDTPGLVVSKSITKYARPTTRARSTSGMTLGFSRTAAGAAIEGENPPLSVWRGRDESGVMSSVVVGSTTSRQNPLLFLRASQGVVCMSSVVGGGSG